MSIIDNQIKKGITKGDIILVVSVLFISAVLFAFSFFGVSEELTAEIYVDGEKLHTIALNEVEESYTLTENYCQLLIEKDGVSFVYSDCSDKLCMKRGKLSKQGDTMACVPEKVVVILRGTQRRNIDAITY